MPAVPLLDFEEDVGKMEAAIELLRESDQSDAVDILSKVGILEKEKEKKLKKLYSELSDWQICLVARHAARPQTRDYVSALIDDFIELHGDRLYADDRAVICGLGRFEDQPVMVLGHQKGGDTKERIACNFGMSNPEGYRKVLRMMELADKFSIPLVSFIDTPGAYPGIGAEERGQSEAIGRCLLRSARLRAPFVVVVIGEGGSGGALAMSAGDHIAMLQYSIYSVISPEGGASILWKDATRMADAAALLGLTAPRLKKLGLVDEIIAEPAGGAHRYREEVVENVRLSIRKALQRLGRLDSDSLLEARQERWRAYGRFKEG